MSTETTDEALEINERIARHLKSTTFAPIAAAAALATTTTMFCLIFEKFFGVRTVWLCLFWFQREDNGKEGGSR